MNMNPEEMVQKLVASGIDESIATSMVNSMIKAENKGNAPKKKAFYSSSPKQEITLIHEDTCQTCGCIVTEKHVTKGYPEEDGSTVKGVRTICHNCPKYLETLGIETLISLLLIQNNPDTAISLLPTTMQIKLAQAKKPVEWIGKKITRQDMSKPEYN